MGSSSKRHARDNEAVLLASGGGRLVLVVRIADRVLSLPGEAVERIVRMAAPTPLPSAPPGVIGLLNLRGALLPVVDPRPRLGLPSPTPHPDQHLVVLLAPYRYLLWVDRADRLVRVDLDPVAGPADSTATAVARVDDDVVPVLSPAAFAPSSIVGAVAAR